MSNLFYEYNKSQYDAANGLEKEMHGEGESEFLLVFNKASGAYIGRTCGHVSETKSDSKHYKYKKISFDPTVFDWRGDYDDGELVRIVDAPVEISEQYVDNQVNYTIREVYDWYHQNNAIMGVVEKLIEKAGLEGEEVDDFNEIYDYIKARRESAQKFKEAYQNSPDFKFESKKEYIERISKELDGGLHEELGPKSQQMPHHDIAEAPDVKDDTIWMPNRGEHSQSYPHNG
mgnify:CR=1 FL=1